MYKWPRETPIPAGVRKLFESLIEEFMNNSCEIITILFFHETIYPGTFQFIKESVPLFMKIHQGYMIPPLPQKRQDKFENDY